MSLPPLDLNSVSPEVIETQSPRSPKEYQKVFSDKVFNWDQLETCAFCQTPVSPRSRTRIIRKHIESKPPVEYSCSKCSRTIVSYKLGESRPTTEVCTDKPEQSGTPRVLIRRNSTDNSARQSSPLKAFCESLNQ